MFNNLFCEEIFSGIQTKLLLASLPCPVACYLVEYTDLVSAMTGEADKNFANASPAALRPVRTLTLSLLCAPGPCAGQALA